MQQKGILIVKFTETFAFFAHSVDLGRLQKLFWVVLEPSWAGYALPEILFWTVCPEPVVVQASEATDRAFLSALRTSLVPVPFGASDWVDPSVFRPLGLPKEFDAVCVANCTVEKRAIAFVSAIRTIRKAGRSFKAALVLAKHGKYRLEIGRVIQLSAVQDSLSIYDSLSQEELNTVLNQARCNVLLSLKEGSNKSIFEGFFADVPGVVLEENIGVNKDYLVPQTGLLVREAGLPDALCSIVDDPARFKPRRWALDNISPAVTTEKLLMTLRSLGDGESREPVCLKVNNPEPSYVSGIDRSRQAELNLQLLKHLTSGTEAARLPDHEALRTLVSELRRAGEVAR